MDYYEKKWQLQKARLDLEVAELIKSRGYDGCDYCKGNDKLCDCNFCYGCYGIEWMHDEEGCDN
jgi:hypothetical protein